MVPVEAMTQSTPVVVPDIGGVAELPFAEGLQAGLNFRSWDSSDLAAQIELLLTDQEMYSRFTAEARDVAKQFSVQRVTDLELQMMGILEKVIKPPIHLHLHTSPHQIGVS